jgi:hypothetical protein
VDVVIFIHLYNVPLSRGGEELCVAPSTYRMCILAWILRQGYCESLLEAHLHHGMVMQQRFWQRLCTMAETLKDRQWSISVYAWLFRNICLQ